MLRTRSPLIAGPKSGSPFDLHVLSTPPAFVLSQDQTLRRDIGFPEPEGPGVRYLDLESADRKQALPVAGLLAPARCSGRIHVLLVVREVRGEPRPCPLTG